MLTIQRACQGFGHINQANAETQNESDAKSQKISCSKKVQIVDGNRKKNQQMEL